MGKSGSAYLPRSNRVNRKRSFPSLAYFDAHHEQRMRECTTLMQDYDSATTSDTQAEESDSVSENEFAPTAASSATARPLPATAEDSDEDRDDFNFGSPSSTAATQGSQSSGN